jgi:pimeloyl-ACP methyl ester carboxylesterase
MWDPQVAALETSYRVITPDLRGFGETPLPPGRFSFAEDVVALLDHLDVETCALVGSSLGGRVALEVAATHPDKVASLVLLCPAFQAADTTPSAKAFEAEEEDLLRQGDFDAAVELNVFTWLGPEASDETRHLVREMQRHAFSVQDAAERERPEPELIEVEVDPTQVSAPTLILTGGWDMDHFQNIAQHLAGSIPRARLQRLPWAAHLPSLERPGEVNQLIAGFLAATGS